MFIEMLTYPFMQRALICGTLIALCSALLGVCLVLKRYSMIGDGLSTKITPKIPAEKQSKIPTING